MKKILSALLCVLLLTGLCTPEYAENALGVTFTATVNGGNTLQSSSEARSVVVSVNTNKEVELDSIVMFVYCPEGWTLTAMNSDDIPYESSNLFLDTYTVAYDTEDTATPYENITGITNILNITYSVPANAVGTFTLGAYDISITKDYGEIWENNATAAVILTIENSNQEASYSASISASSAEVTIGNNVGITVSGSASGAQTTFGSSEITVAYNNTLFEYVSTSGLGIGSATANNGTVTIHDYGAEKSLANAYTLTFKALAAGEGVFTLGSASFGTGTDSETSDLTAATIVTATATVAANPAVIPGTDGATDVNGDGEINLLDLLRLTANIFENDTFTAEQTALWDINGDGTVTSNDIKALQTAILED